MPVYADGKKGCLQSADVELVFIDKLLELWYGITKEVQWRKNHAN